MSTAFLLACAVCVAGLATGLAGIRWARRRLELAADAEHELRGPLTAIAMIAARLERDEASVDVALALEAQLARASAALADFERARTGLPSVSAREPIPLEGLLAAEAAGFEPLARRDGRRVLVEGFQTEAVRGDRRRLAQALGNLIQNAVQHGSGDVLLRTERSAGGVRLVVTNTSAGRRAERVPARRAGRGLRIAARAAEEAGGRLVLAQRGRSRSAAVELPAAERGG